MEEFFDLNRQTGSLENHPLMKNKQRVLKTGNSGFRTADFREYFRSAKSLWMGLPFAESELTFKEN